MGEKLITVNGHLTYNLCVIMHDRTRSWDYCEN